MPISRRFKRRAPRDSQKSTLTRLILEKIGEAGEILLDSFFPAKYPEARLWRNILGLNSSYKFERATFASLLSKFKAQRLVEKVTKPGGRHWRLTTQGRSYIREPYQDELPRSDGRKRLVCFDIPEYDRAKRRWLRTELMACGYRPLQKSVWIGEAPLPQAFITELDVLELRDRVHILLVESGGSLDGQR